MRSSDKLSLGIAIVASVALLLVFFTVVWGEVEIKKQEIKSANCIGEASYQVPLVTYHQL